MTTPAEYYQRDRSIHAPALTPGYKTCVPIEIYITDDSLVFLWENLYGQNQDTALSAR